MQTKTFTLLVTVTDDGSAAVFNPIILAAAVQGALENGCRFVLDSTQVEALQRDPLINATVGEHRLPPVASATSDAFDGDRLRTDMINPVVREIRKAQSLHAELRKGA